MATASSNSSKHKDIIAKSFEISPGSPTVYQIGTQNQNFRTVTRKTVGEKDPNRKNKTILLVGETGSGKSTLINVLLNYTMGVKFEDNVWFEIIEDDKRNHTESQMSDVIVYEIFGFEDQTFPYSFTIIDTPGYESARGIEHDLLISQKLSDLLRSENGIHELHAVCLVIKASDRKLSYQVRYNFDSLLSLFGEDIENRTVVVITHSGGKTTTNVLKAIKNKNFKCAVNDNNEPVCFQFENCQREQRTDKTIKALQNAWDLTKEGLDQFTCFLDKSGKASQNLKPNITNLNVHIRLTACVHNLQERLKLVDLQQQKLQQTQEVLKKYEEQKENNEELFVDVDEVYKVKETIKGGKWWLLFSNQAVCCTICEENCHYPGCTRAQSPADCEIMRNGHCTSCTGECPASAHVKENWRFVFNKRRVNKSLTEVRETYEKESSENERKVTLMEIIQKQMEALSEQKSKLLGESCQHIVTLEEIAVKGHSLSTHIHLDYLSEKMRETGHTMRLQELEKIRSQMDDTIRAVLHPRFINTSEYSDIISTSSLMRSGSPAVYQLTPTIENIGTLTRKAVGKKDQWQKHKAILLVGETGAGKSSLINTLLNYTMGVTFEDNIWFEVVEREKRRKSRSQTLDVVVYEIFQLCPTL